MENHSVLSTDLTQLDNTDSLDVSFSGQICLKCAQRVFVLARDNMSIAAFPPVSIDNDAWRCADAWIPLESSYLVTLEEDIQLSPSEDCKICSSLRSCFSYWDETQDLVKWNIKWRIEESGGDLELSWKMIQFQAGREHVRHGFTSCVPIDC